MEQSNVGGATGAQEEQQLLKWPKADKSKFVKKKKPPRAKPVYVYQCYIGKDGKIVNKPPPAPNVFPRAASVAESLLAAARASASEAAPEAASEALSLSLDEPRRSVAVSIPCVVVVVVVVLEEKKGRGDEIFFLFRKLL